ncbi:expressed unknown protein [Seminavis robusta]|uniref:Uncharacterized protein n=1 Tax=Seminavis robusta TaxID=568900 RepID=A0A9N8E9Q4_9STRA|nr:expressed unknown protein [Seminavis robusta]|eukprot:Sro782_g201780.1 n/a (368) ;mRNA; f:31172-32275
MDQLMKTLRPYWHDPTQIFIHTTLSPITGRPDYTSLKRLEKENKDNARRVFSSRGDEGHLRLCYTLKDYNARANIAGNIWIDPVNPGPRPNIPIDATEAQVCLAVVNHHYEFHLYHSTENALLKKAMEAVEEVYYKALEDPDLGYYQIKYIDFIQHLRETYGELDDDDLSNNIKRMNAPWTPTQPIQQLFNQIKNAQAFARDHDIISEKTAVRSAMTNLENSGAFPRDMKEWRLKPEADHTWNNFKIHFTAANKERLRTITTKEAGFHDQANKANQPQKDNPYIVRDSNGKEIMAYCFSHGLQWDLTHTSMTCRNRHKDHNEEATVSNMCGGLNRIKRQPGEVAIFKYQPSTTNRRTNGKENCIKQR